MNAPFRFRDEDAIDWRPRVLIRKCRNLRVQADFHVDAWRLWVVENRAVIAQWPIRIRPYLIDACRDHNVLAADILGPHRFAYVQPARRELAHRLHSEARMSLSQIAKRMCRKDHSTIISLIRRHLGLPRRGVKL